MSLNPNRQPRIAFLNPDLWVGGGTIFLLNLGGELVSRGYQTQVFSMARTNSLAADFEQRRIPVHLNDERRHIFEDRVKAVIHQMREVEPDIVVASACVEACEVLRNLPAGVRRIGVIHSVSQIETAAVYADAFESVVGVSDHVKDLALQRPELGDGKVCAIELGVPVPALPIRTRPDQGPIRILYLGRLEERAKRVRLFPQIKQALDNAGLNYQWTIAGDGPERKFLEEAMGGGTADQGQRIHFSGLVNYRDVPELLEQNDIILLTSDTEVFPLSLQEGMAYGLVPVVSDLPGRVRQIVTNDTGCLVPINEVDGYAQAIIWLAKNRGELARMSANATTLIGANYSVSAMADRWLGHLQQQAPVSAGEFWKRDINIVPPLFSINAPLRFSFLGRMIRRLGLAFRTADRA